MTFLDLAKEIDTAKVDLAEAATELKTVTAELDKANSLYLVQQQRVADLMRQMQEMLGLVKTNISDVPMKELALQGQAVRGSFKK